MFNHFTRLDVIWCPGSEMVRYNPCRHHPCIKIYTWQWAFKQKWIKWLTSRLITSVGVRRGSPPTPAAFPGLSHTIEEPGTTPTGGNDSTTERERNARCSSQSVTPETRSDKDFITSGFGSLFTWPLDLSVSDQLQWRHSLTHMETSACHSLSFPGKPFFLPLTLSFQNKPCISV